MKRGHLWQAASYLASGQLAEAEDRVDRLPDDRRDWTVAAITRAVEAWAQRDPLGTNDRAADELDKEIGGILDDAEKAVRS